MKKQLMAVLMSASLAAAMVTPAFAEEASSEAETEGEGTPLRSKDYAPDWSHYDELIHEIPILRTARL